MMSKLVSSSTLIPDVPETAVNRAFSSVTCPKPKIIEDRDVILKITGSTVCGSDLHLLHGSVVEMQKGDILGHEFCGIVDEMGPGVKNLKKGDRVVASFQIACGSVCPSLSTRQAKTG